MREREFIAALTTIIVLGIGAQSAQAGGVTNLGDDARTGWYQDQPALTPSAVASPTFGQLFSTQLTGQIFAQPLVSNGTLLAATEENNVYGMDPATGSVKWQRHLHPPFDATASPVFCGDLQPHIGITSTPVIDPVGSGTAYLTSKVGTGDPVYANGTWLMHAVDVADGSEKPGFPVVMGGSADNLPGVAFNGVFELQRPGLLLQDGAVYAAFGGHCDAGLYQGWVFRVTTAGTVTARWVAVPSGVRGGGIWQAGTGLASDGDGNVLLTTGNGFGTAATPHGGPIAGSAPPAGLSEAMVRLKLQSDGKLKSTDFFTPANAAQLDEWDADFASGGPIVYPPSFGTPQVPRVLGAIGKSGILYTLDRDSLGGFARGVSGSDAVVDAGPQRFGVWGKPSIFGGDGGWVYVTTAGLLDVYRRVVDSSGIPRMTLCAATSFERQVGLGSSPVVVTSNGTATGSALAWATTMPYRDGGGASLSVFSGTPTCMTEYTPIRTWSIGTGTRYSPPGVAGGKIYVGNLEGRLIGFGQPTQTALTAAGTFLGSSTVGTATTGNVTITAGIDPATISSFSTTALTGFTVQSSGLSFPIHLAAGDSVDVPIRFLPTKPGPVGSTLTANTGRGAVTFAIAADALASGPWLKLSPAAVTFGSTVYKTTGRASLTIANQGNAQLLINSVSSLPTGVALQSGITFPIHVPSGSSVALGLTWKPSAVGSLKSSITLRTNGGEAAASRTVGLLGFSVKPGHLTLSPGASLSFGSVKVGSHLSKTLVLRNTGGATVTLTKYKPPVGGAFRQSGSLDEGGKIAPGKSVKVNFVFTPTFKNSVSSSLYVTGDDGSGPRVVKLTGRGV